MYATGRGRGPTRFISPRTTFHSSGSSSRLERRSRRPTRVMRAASGSPGEPGGRMVRNFRRPNGRPSSPARWWTKRRGRPSASRTRTATTASTGASRMARPPATVRFTMPARRVAAVRPRAAARPAATSATSSWVRRECMGRERIRPARSSVTGRSGGWPPKTGCRCAGGKYTRDSIPCCARSSITASRRAASAVASVTV